MQPMGDKAETMAINSVGKALKEYGFLGYCVFTVCKSSHEDEELSIRVNCSMNKKDMSRAIILLLEKEPEFRKEFMRQCEEKNIIEFVNTDPEMSNLMKHVSF